MYKLGIIGGMGPLATVRFYEKIVLQTEAKKDNDHIDLVVLNHATIPDRTTCIIEEQGEDFLEAIKGDFEKLEQLGVDTVAIPCNTSHYYFEEFSQFTDLQIINMIEETVLEVKKRGNSTIVVFGTVGTVTSKVYDKYAAKHGIQVQPLSSEDMYKVADIIYGIKATNNLETDQFEDILKRYCTDDIVGVIACTELSLLAINKEINTIDAMDVLVEKSIISSGKRLKTL